MIIYHKLFWSLSCYTVWIKQTNKTNSQKDKTQKNLKPSPYLLLFLGEGSRCLVLTSHPRSLSWLLSVTFTVGFQIFYIGCSIMYCIGEGHMPVVTSWSELTKVTNMLSRTIDPFPVFLIPAKKEHLWTALTLWLAISLSALLHGCGFYAWNNAMNSIGGREFKVMESFNLSFHWTNIVEYLHILDLRHLKSTASNSSVSTMPMRNCSSSSIW